jgi:hypothetical protein
LGLFKKVLGQRLLFPFAFAFCLCFAILKSKGKAKENQGVAAQKLKGLFKGAFTIQQLCCYLN